MKYRIEYNANREDLQWEPQSSGAWLGGWESFYEFGHRPCVRFSSYTEATSFLAEKESERMASIKRAKEYKSKISFIRWP